MVWVEVLREVVAVPEEVCSMFEERLVRCKAELRIAVELRAAETKPFPRNDPYTSAMKS